MRTRHTHRSRPNTAPHQPHPGLLAWLLSAMLALGLLAPALAQDAAPDAGPAPATRVNEKVTLSLYAPSTDVAPGSVIPLAVVINFETGWHAWPSVTQDVLPPEIADFAIRTSVELAEQPAWVAATGPVQWPEPHPAPVADPMGSGKPLTVPLYKDTAIAFLPIRIAADAPPGMQRLEVLISYQACDDKQCLAPEEVRLGIPLNILAPGATPPVRPEAGETSRFFASLRPETLSAVPATSRPAATQPAEQEPAAPDNAALSPPPAASAPPVGGSFFGLSLQGMTNGPLGWLVLALLAAVGGFILNLTPCVLPVIPIKILTLTKHAGSPRRSFILGLWMALGVVAFWLGLGIPAAFISSFADPAILFGIWWLTTLIGLVIGALGLGIMGLFTFNLPQQLYMVNPEADSPGGSFLFGVMTAVLGLPCFGFVAGALLPTAAILGPAATIIVFGAMGVGMAAPYLVLAAKPSLLKALPKTGPASELIKQVMGLLLLAAAAFFVGTGFIALVIDYPYLGRKLHWWIAALFGVAAGAWLVFKTIQITRSPARRALFSLVGLALASGGVWAAWSVTQDERRTYEERERQIAAAQGTQSSGSIPTGVWLEYSEPLLQRARAEGKTVVLDFTAEWCLNCKALKAAVLDVPPVQPAFREQGVVLLEVDVTSNRAPGRAKLRELTASPIPLLVVYGPGLPEPWLSNAYTSDQVLAALALAARKPQAPQAGLAGNATEVAESGASQPPAAATRQAH